MEGKVILIIIFNHKYDKNIPVLEQIYKNRFSKILYLVPFYKGDRKDVIPVYENSFYFQGYLAQGFKYYYNEDYEHYFFIGDDLILNPLINERNFKEYFQMDSSFSFLPNFISLQDVHKWHWLRLRDAYEYQIKHLGVEINDELPDNASAVQALTRQIQKKIMPLQFKQVYPNPGFSLYRKKLKKYLKWWNAKIIHTIKRTKFNLNYPLIGSYSDIFIISSDTIKNFCHYCGVFAATNLHVELAIPTALALSTSKIITEKDLLLQGKACWTSEDYKELDKYSYNLQKLLDEFPKLYLYLHPVKLSKWH